MVGPTEKVTLRKRGSATDGVNEYWLCRALKKSDAGSPPSLVSLPRPK